jgi:hypothetical protein
MRRYNARLPVIFMVLAALSLVFCSTPVHAANPGAPAKHLAQSLGDGSHAWLTGYFGTTLYFEGSTDDAYETTITVTDPTADRTVTIPNKTGEVKLSSAGSALTAGAAITLTVGLSNVYTLSQTDNQDATITFSGAGTAGDEITIIFTTVGTADEVITFHATLVSSTGTLTIGATADRYYAVTFISNGTHWFEKARTAVQT